MENTFYNKYKNLHITDNLNIIDPYKLIDGDSVMLLNGDTEVTSTHLKFNGIINNNIIVFNKLDTKADYYNTYTSTSVHYDCENVNKTYFYYENGQYMSVYSMSSYDLNTTLEFRRHLYKIHKKNKKGKFISGKFIVKSEKDENLVSYGRESVKIFSYLLFPTGTEDMKAIINFDLENDKDYLVYFKSLNSPTGANIPFFDASSYKINAKLIMNLLNLEQTKDVQWFNDVIKSKDYRTREYIEDPNREETLKYINGFLTENYDKTSCIKLVFENKDIDIKAYVEGNRTFISWKDKYRSYNDGRGNNFETQRFYMAGSSVLTIEIDKEVKDNLEFQQWYKIAYDIAEFYVNKRGVNPETGDYYIKGQIDNNHILYKDYDGIVARGNYDNNDIYVKRHGYYIKEDSKEEIQEVLDRMNVLENLKNAK